jgi:CBS domain-containing protein
MNIGEICSRRPVTASARAPLSDVARLMYENHVGSVVLTLAPADRPTAVGILTDRDIICAQVRHGADLSRLPASQEMTPDPLSFREITRVEDALACMRAKGVRRAIVLDDTGALTGVVSIDDILLNLSEQVAAIGRTLETQAVHST